MDLSFINNLTLKLPEVNFFRRVLFFRSHSLSRCCFAFLQDEKKENNMLGN